MPSKQEILERATSLFMRDNHGAGYGETLPEEHELKEDGYFDRARHELMCSDYTQDSEVVDQAFKEIAELDKVQTENDKLQVQVYNLNRKLCELEQSKLVQPEQSREQSGEIRDTDTKDTKREIQISVLKRGHCSDCSSWAVGLMTRAMPFKSKSYGHCSVSNCPTNKDSSCRAWKPINNGNNI